MRRAVRFTVGAGFVGALAGGLAFDHWPLTIVGAWGVLWVATWEPS